MSGNGSFSKSMNGIVSLDTGGSTIEGSKITTTEIDASVVNATSEINTSFLYTDYISAYANSYVSFFSQPRSSFTPLVNDDLCNKNYVDNATSGTNILSLTNIFTGISNTFNNVIYTSNIDSIYPSSTYNFLPSHRGQINIGPSGATGSINMGSATVPVRSSYTPIMANDLCNKSYVDTVNSNLISSTNTWTGTSNTFNNVVNIGPTGATGPSQLKLLSNGISTTKGTDTIEFGIGVTSGTVYVGKDLGNGGGSVILSNNFRFYNDVPNDTLHMRTINQFDKVEFCGHLTGGSLAIGSKLTYGTLNIGSTGMTGNINIGNGSTGGTINIGSTGASTANINLGTGITTGSLNVCTAMTTGNINIGNAMTTGTIYIGNTTGATNNAEGNIVMGNSDNSSNTANNGRVTINKLQVGPGSAYRCMILGRNIGAGAVGQQAYTIPGAPTTFGNPLVFAMLNSGTAAFGNPNTIYGVMINITGVNTFNYKKVYNGGTADGESFNYMAIWI
jgi:hypothetical protein